MGLLGALLVIGGLVAQQRVRAQDGSTLFLPLVNNAQEDSPSPTPTPTSGPLTIHEVVVGVADVAGQPHVVAGAKSGYPGMMLYTYAEDNEGAGASACRGECAAIWPPLTIADAADLLSMAEIAADIGTLPRADGTQQLTYGGWPLYRYAGDTVPAQANGDGLNGLWWSATVAQDADEADGERPTQNRVAPIASTILADFAEVGSMTVGQSDRAGWHTVELMQTYDQPVVVMQPISYRGAHPATIRVRNVTVNSFQFKIDEWPYLDGWHTAENVHYMVVEAGVHTMPNAAGQTLQAGTVEVNHLFKSVTFAQPFAEPSTKQQPVVLAQITSAHDEEPIVTRLRRVQATKFELRVQEAEASNGGHAAETVGYVAFMPGQYILNGQTLEARLTGNRVTHRWHALTFGAAYKAPAFLAAMQTFDGGDTAGLRYTNLGTTGVQVFVEEEQSKNKETRHTTEVVGYVVVGQQGGVAPTVTPVPPTPTLPPTVTPAPTPTNTATPEPATPTPIPTATPTVTPTPTVPDTPPIMFDPPQFAEAVQEGSSIRVTWTDCAGGVEFRVLYGLTGARPDALTTTERTILTPTLSTLGTYQMIVECYDALGNSVFSAPRSIALR